MDADTLNAAIVAAIKDTVVPHVDKEKVSEIFGAAEAELIAARVSDLVHEAASTPIVWGDVTLQEGVNEILRRFHDKHPDLTREALHEIGRCVGWNLR
ncbi:MULTISPECIES: hypothetical protein [unclassified Mycobacterium]|uniref:hypothetical protein n=1 Tax=unclassified Mycobacterium TaxID=2642494 RepID=UPI0009ED3E98|nr:MULTISPECIES: hypothetical protein [unclassified Mycobacterium]